MFLNLNPIKNIYNKNRHAFVCLVCLSDHECVLMFMYILFYSFVFVLLFLSRPPQHLNFPTLLQNYVWDKRFFICRSFQKKFNSSSISKYILPKQYIYAQLVPVLPRWCSIIPCSACWWCSISHCSACGDVQLVTVLFSGYAHLVPVLPAGDAQLVPVLPAVMFN